MKEAVIPVEVKALLPTNTKEQGTAVCLGNDQKIFCIFVDGNIGVAIAMFMSKKPKERPLTHDLIGHIFRAFEITVERVVINDLRDSTYFARLILRSENEVHRKLTEIDARPSDSIALAMQAGAPLFVAQHVWDMVEDISGQLKDLGPDDHAESEDD